MVWALEKQNFKSQLDNIAIDAALCTKSNRRFAEEYIKTIQKGWVFLKNLEELNDFYNNDESIEAVLRAAVLYFDARHTLNFEKRHTQKASNYDIEQFKRELLRSHLDLTAQSQRLVTKMESPDENMYAIHGQSKIRCNAFSIGFSAAAAIVGFSLILSVAVAAGPVGATALAFGIVSLVIGAMVGVISARNLQQNKKLASGVQLEEISDFVDFLNPEPPVKNFRLTFGEQSREEDIGLGAPSYS